MGASGDGDGGVMGWGVGCYGTGSGTLWDGACGMLWGEGAGHHRTGRGALRDTTRPRWSRTLWDKRVEEGVTGAKVELGIVEYPNEAHHPQEPN